MVKNVSYFTSQLFFLVPFTLTLCSCGKNISEKDIQVARQIGGQEDSGRYSLKIDTSKSRRVLFRMPRPATFKIPPTVDIVGGTSTGKTLVIRYNGSEVDKNDFEFQCTYRPQGGGRKMNLFKCTDYYGDNLGDVSNHLFALEFGDIIDMEVIGPIHFDIVVESIHEMKWF